MFRLKTADVLVAMVICIQVARGTTSAGNTLVTCAACMEAEAKFDSWNCEMDCHAVKGTQGKSRWNLHKQANQAEFWDLCQGFVPNQGSKSQ